MKLFTTTSLFALSIATPSIADVIDVGGPHPDAATIGAATSLASSGDVIRIHPGQYPSFTIDGKSLSLVAENPLSVQVYGVVRIRNLGPNQSVELSGLNPTNASALKLIASDCLGAVRVNSCVFRNNVLTPAGAVDFVAEVTNTAGIAFHNCQFTGRGHGIVSMPGNGHNGIGGIKISDSSVAMYDCTTEGGNGESRLAGTLGNPADGGHGGHAVWLIGNGDFFASGSHMLGGAPGYGDGLLGWDGFCGYGIEAYAANYQIRILDNNVVGTSGPCTSAIGLGTMPASTVTTMLGAATLLEGPSWLRDTDILPITLKAEIGSRVAVLFSTGHANHFAGMGGPLLVQIPGGPFNHAYGNLNLNHLAIET